MAKKIIKAQMKQRTDTKANWASSNPVLLKGELGIVSDDPNLYKVGDGVTAWNALPFRGFNGTVVNETGTSETAVMSQKAVTEELAKFSKETEEKLSGGIVSLTVGIDYERESGAWNASGVLVSPDYQWRSTAIALQKGDSIYVKRQYGGNSWILVQVTENGEWIKGLVTSGGQLEATYTAQEDIYVSVCYLKANAETFRDLLSLEKTTKGLTNRVFEIGAEVAKIDNPVIVDIVEGVDYTISDGYYNVFGEFRESAAYWHSTPIALQKGQSLKLRIPYLSLSAWVFETDDEGSYHKPLFFREEGVNDYEYIASNDCKVVFCYNAGQQLSAQIVSGGMLDEINKSAIEQSEKSGEILFRSLPKFEDYFSTIISVRQRDSANIRKACFDRQKALDEIKMLGESHILKDANGNKVEGSCGYYEDAEGNVTDGSIKWEIYDNGVLYIHGYGKFYDFVKGTQKAMTAAAESVFPKSASMWYYGFVTPNVNGFTNPIPPSQWVHHSGGEAVTYPHPRRYLPQSYGDSTNPINGKPFGYAAPWYIYRSDIDWEYETLTSYNTYNPNGFKYNRIVIDEDLTNGGITYVGMWTFYRCCVESLILPSKCKYIAEWGVRYSPTMRTLVWGDEVTECESLASSRMETLETVHISNTLTTIHGESMLAQNPLLQIVELPTTLTSLPYGAVECISLLSLVCDGVTSFAERSVLTPHSLQIMEFAEGVVSIGQDAFVAGMLAKYQKGLRYVHIPSSVTTIEDGAFTNHSNLEYLRIDSETISRALNNNLSCGRIAINAKIILIPNGNAVGNFIKIYYDRLCTFNGYDLYGKRGHFYSL